MDILHNVQYSVVKYIILLFNKMASIFFVTVKCFLCSLLGFPLEMGVMVMPLAMPVSGMLRGKLLIILGGAGARGRIARCGGGVSPLTADFMVIGGGTNTVRTW